MSNPPNPPPPPPRSAPPGQDELPPESHDIPPVEPPAPIAARYRPVTAGQWVSTRASESPYWMTSLVLHLAIMLVMGSFIPNVTRHPGKNSLVFVGAFSAEEQQDAEKIVEVVANDSEGEKDKSNEEEAAEQPEPEAEDQGNEGDEDNENDTEQQPDEEQQPPAEPEPETVELPEEATIDDDPFADLTAEGGAEPKPPEDRLVESTAAYVAAEPLFWIHTASVDASLSQSNDTDRVVDRFIDYDIGKLRGQEAEVARREFDQLGEDSIPALVRGLNKSASIKATCPVGVLSRRLEQELKQTANPAMIRYAMDNIGVGVPVRAPHRLRLESLKERLRQYFLDQGRAIKKLMDQRRIPENAQIVLRTNRMLARNDRALIAGLKGRDEQSQLSAMLALTVRDRRLSRTRRHEAAEGLIGVLRSDASESIKQQAHLTLRTLADDYLAEAPQATEGAGASLADRWSQTWNRMKTQQSEARAGVLFREGSKAERGGRLATAVGVYNNVVKMYPGTAYAAQAQRRLSTMNLEPLAQSQLTLASNLEKNGRRTSAVRRYRQVIASYPRSNAAAQARSRLQRMSAGATE